MSASQSFDLVSGPVNARCIAPMPDGNIIYLGRDWNLYRLTLPANAATDESAPGASLVAPQAQGYIAGWCDTRDTVTPHVRYFADANLLWIWVNGLANVPVAFIFDPRDGTISGPLHDPPIAFCDQPEGCAVLTGITPDGRPLYWDPSGQVPAGDVLANASATPTYATPTTAALSEGELISGVRSDLSVWVTDARVGYFLWNWFDPSPEYPRKTLLSVRFQTLPNSAGLVCVTVESDTVENGARVSDAVYYGEVYGRTDHLVPIMVSGNCFRIGVTVVCAAGRSCAIRNFQYHWAPAGTNN